MIRPSGKLLLFVVTLLWVIGPLSVWAGSEAHAQDGRISAAVLNLEGDNVDAELVETLTSIVRNEAQQVEKYEVVNKYALNFKDVLLLVGCDSQTRSCLRRAAEQVEARVLIFGSVRKEGSKFRTSVNIFDADSGKMINQLTRTLEQTDDPVVAFRKEIEAFFADERTIPVTRVQIGSNIDGAKIRLEGTYVGTVPLERKGLPPGTYTIEVFHPDYVTWETRLELTEGADVRLWAPLKPKEVKTVVETKTDPTETTSNNVATQTTTTEVKTDLKADATPTPTRSGPNWGAWSTIGVGALALTGSAVFAVLMTGVEDDIETLNRQELTPSRYDELVQKGESYELTHRVLLGVGLVGIIGGFTWLLVDRASEPDGVALDLGVSPTGVEARVRW